MEGTAPFRCIFCYKGIRKEASKISIYNNVSVTYADSVKSNYGNEKTSGFVLTDENGTQRFERNLLSASKKLSFGHVMSREELLAEVDAQIQSNQDKKHSLEDMIKNTCINASSATFQFVGEDKIYSFYEYIDELKSRSEAMNEK